MKELFPAPVEKINSDGTFDFKNKLYLTVGADFDNSDFFRISKELLLNFTCKKAELEINRLDTVTNTAVISCESTPELFEGATGFEYELDIEPDGIKIKYSKSAGLIHAFSSFLLLIEPYCRKTQSFSVKCCHISDSPAIEFRGMHIVVFPELSYSMMRKSVRMCGLLKCSHIVLEFWGMLKFDFMKELAWNNAFTKEQVREIISDAVGMGMECIPMMNQLGHASYSRFKSGKHVLLDQAPEYEELFEEGGWTWNVKHPETKEILSKARDELMELFPSEYFHCGCDEAYDRDGRHDPDDPEVNEVFISYMNYLTDDLRKHGKKAMFWGDMFLDNKTFPYPCASQYVMHCTRCDENLAKFDKDAYIVDWQYSLNEDDTRTLDYFLRTRDPKKMILSSFDEREPILGHVNLVKKRGLFGVLGTTWHRLNLKFLQTVIFTPCVMWSGNSGLYDLCTDETMKSFAGRYLSKLLPCNGVYEDSGFFEYQVYPDIDG